MADAALSAVINKIIDISATLVVEEFSRLYRLHEEINWLERQMRLMQAYTQAAEENKVTNPTVATFIKGIRELAYDVEDIFDVYIPRIQEHKSSALLKRITCTVPHSVTCSNFSREIEKIKRRIQEIKEDKENYSIPDINIRDEAEAANEDPRTTTLDVDDSLIVGFDEHIEQVKIKLKKHQFVTIVGMAGLGKTTLAKKVFNGLKGEFERAASVSVSQDPKINSLLINIAKQVGLLEVNLTDSLEVELTKNLEADLKSLLQKKRYLLLLDDIWSIDVWNELRECLSIDSGETASRIIITSQDNRVGRYVGCEDALHFLTPFDESTSWELFSKSIMPFFNTVEEFEHSELKKIGEKIVKKCGGVPLAIVLVVGLLRQREKSKFCWNDVLNNIGHDATDRCFQIFSLSYQYLPKALKLCFLYLGSFPEDYEYSTFELVRMWVAEKLVLGIRGRDAEDVGDNYISELDSWNLIQVVKRELDGRVNTFRVHDLLYNQCVEKGREFDFFNTVDRLESASASKVRRLGVFGNDVLKYDMPKIRGLFHFKFATRNQQKHLKTTLGKSRLLRVLMFQSTLDSFHFPTSVGSLCCLNYLHVGSPTRYVEIPVSIQNLKNLEILIVESETVKIPIGVWKMAQLKHVLLYADSLEYHKCNYYLQLARGLQVQVSLPNIQTLHLPRTSQTRLKYGHLLTNLSTLRKLSLKEMTPDMMEALCGREAISNNLETLKCVDLKDGHGVRINLSKYGMLKSLWIGCFSPLDLHDHEFPRSLIEVTIWNCTIRNSTVETLKKLPKLKMLELINLLCHGSYEMDCSGGFLQLEVLKLNWLPYLKELIEGEGEEMGMPKLRQLVIQDCPYLQTIPERLQQLPA